MIVCHCNVITKDEIRAAIRALRAEDPYRVIIPGLVYHRLRKRGRCCACFPEVAQLIAEEPHLLEPIDRSEEKVAVEA